ncbi:MAG: pyridoxal phosphate-dependent aminotransferase [Promethearchaeota archaeon]|jgi:aspartate/methionine/tyrosine aminotransferase
MELFDDDSVNLGLLKKHATNRWAIFPEQVIPLTAADPDFQAAPEIRKAIKEFAVDGTFSYGSDGGNLDFRKVIAETVKARKMIPCLPEHVHVTNGVAQAMMLTVQAVCGYGDEVILFDPVDFLFGKSIDYAGVKRVYSKIDTESREFDIDGLNDLVTPKTRMICICNPHNPLGRVLSKRELKGITDFALENDLIIMSDEIWSDIVYDGWKHISTASISPEVAENVVSLYGFSKTFAMAGLHLGYMVITNPVLLSKVKSIAPGYFFPVNNISQAAGKAAYMHGWYWALAFLNHLQKIKEYSLNRLKKMEGIQIHEPEGTYVLFPNISSYGMKSEEFTSFLRKNANVVVVPGHGPDFSYFGPGGEGHIRIVFSTSMRIMREALNRIEEAIMGLQ